MRCQFLCHVLTALFFIKIALKLSYFCKKIAKFWALGGSAPRPQCLRRLGALPPVPQPPIGLRWLGAPPPDPQNSPPLRISGYAPVRRYIFAIEFIHCKLVKLFLTNSSHCKSSSSSWRSVGAPLELTEKGCETKTMFSSCKRKSRNRSLNVSCNSEMHIWKFGA